MSLRPPIHIHMSASCPICLDESPRRLATLNCAHTACATCAASLLVHNTATHVPTRCPVCRTNITHLAFASDGGEGDVLRVRVNHVDAALQVNDLRTLFPRHTRTLLTKGGVRVDLNDGDAADAVLRREAEAGRRVMLIASSSAPPVAPRRRIDVVALARQYVVDAVNWTEVKDALRALVLSAHPDARLIDFRDDAFGNAVRSRAPPRRSGRPRIMPDLQGDPMNIFF